MRLLSLLIFALSLGLWTIMSMDIKAGSSIHWGYLEYALWLMTSLTTVGLGYSLAVTDRR